MLNKYFFLLFLLLFLLCCKDNDNNNSLTIKELKLLNKNNFDLKNILEKQNLKNPKDLIITNNNYYYLISKLFYENYNENYYPWFFYFINNAIISDNIFKNEALELYLFHLIKNKNWILLKKIITDNKDLLLNKKYEIYLKFIDDKSLNDINFIPDNIKIFPLLHKIIKSNPKDLEIVENQLKIENYIINSKIYNLSKNNQQDDNINNNYNFKENFNEIISYFKNNYFLSCISNYFNKNKEMFNKNLEKFLNNSDQISYQKLEILKKLSIDLGLRKDFFKLLSLYYKNNKYSKYFYGIEVIYYVNYSKGLEILKESLLDFNLNSSINYNIRGIILNSSFSLNDNWLNEFINYYNDYPNSIRTNDLFYRLLNKIITYINNYSKIDLFKKFPLNSMDTKEKELFYYYLFLVDNKNKEEWKNIILKEFPLSFSALKINNGNISINKKNLIEKIKKETDLSKNAKLKLEKIKYLLEFSFVNDVQNISLDDLTNNEKIIIYDCIYNYLIFNNDFYNSLKYVRLIVDIIYDNNYYKIDDLDILKRLYPVPYKELIFKYSNIHDVDPAYSFAVMREESNFKNDVVSYKNAIGLMQIIPSTGKFISQKLNIDNYDLTNPEDNINMGIYYLKFLQKYFNKKEYILASYNAGPNKTQRWYNYYKSFPDEIKLELIPIYETRNYVKKVMQSYYIYDYLIENHLNNTK